MSQSAIELRGVSHAFEDRFVLRDIHVDILQGEAIALLGANGVGKTTLLRIIAHLLSPTRGSIRLLAQERGEDIATIRHQIGVLFMEEFLYDELTVEENLLFYAKLYGLTKPKKIIAEWLEKFGMQNHARQLARTLSRGERRKIGITRTFFHNPRLVLLDEPTTGLDQQATALMRDLLQEKKGAVTLVCATHNREFLEGWIDRSLEVKEGRLLS